MNSRIIYFQIIALLSLSFNLKVATGTVPEFTIVEDSNNAITWHPPTSSITARFIFNGRTHAVNVSPSDDPEAIAQNFCTLLGVTSDRDCLIHVVTEITDALYCSGGGSSHQPPDGLNNDDDNGASSWTPLTSKRTFHWSSRSEAKATSRHGRYREE